MRKRVARDSDPLVSKSSLSESTLMVEEDSFVEAKIVSLPSSSSSSSSSSSCLSRSSSSSAASSSSLESPSKFFGNSGGGSSGSGSRRRHRSSASTTPATSTRTIPSATPPPSAPALSPSSAKRRLRRSLGGSSNGRRSGVPPPPLLPVTSPRSSFRSPRSSFGSPRSIFPASPSSLLPTTMPLSLGDGGSGGSSSSSSSNSSNSSSGVYVSPTSPPSSPDGSPVAPPRYVRASSPSPSATARSPDQPWRLPTPSTHYQHHQSQQQQNHHHHHRPIQCFAYPNNYNNVFVTKRSRGGLGPALLATGRASLYTVLLFFLSVGSVYMYTNHASSQAAFEAVLNERDALLTERTAWERRTLESKRQAANDVARAKVESDARVADAIRERNVQFGRAERVWKETERLRNEIGKISKTDVLERFGPGPYRVELKLAIPTDVGGGGGGINDEDNNDEPTSYTEHFLVVETAPLSDAPHAVDLFLRQVEAKLWDGTQIWRNREHILMTRLDDTSKLLPGDAGKMARFRQLNLDRLSFAEYAPPPASSLLLSSSSSSSPPTPLSLDINAPAPDFIGTGVGTAFRHEKYTLGFAGHPVGGPLWYINKMDNERFHSPDPSRNYGGDACFARVVEETGGRDLVDLISGMESDADDRLVRPVIIREAYILVWAEEGGAAGRWVHHSR